MPRAQPLAFIASLFAMTIVAAAPAAAQSIQRDVAYGTDPAQRLDLSLPAAKGFPTVVFIHGGSLQTGDKGDEDYGKVCAPFPAAGIACANINYRLRSVHPWPAAAEDVAAAVAWVRHHIAAEGGDSTALFLMGHSSGAMLAALIGADERYLAEQRLSTTALRGVIVMGSIMRDLELERRIEARGRAPAEALFRPDGDYAIFPSLDAYLDHWPMRHVHAGMPPYLFFIADSEQVSPPVLATNREFVERARALGNEAEYRVLPGESHYTVIHKLSEPGNGVFGMVREFIRKAVGGG